MSGIHYTPGVESQHSADEIIEAILALAPDKQENIMTALQQLEQKGEKRGMQQEKLHIAKNMLSPHEPKEKIQQFTGLSQLRSRHWYASKKPPTISVNFLPVARFVPYKCKA